MSNINQIIVEALKGKVPEIPTTDNFRKAFSTPHSEKVVNDRKVNQLGGRQLLTRFNLDKSSSVRGI